MKTKVFDKSKVSREGMHKYFLYKIGWAVRHVVNEERTGFELGLQRIYGLIGWRETPYCQRRKWMF